jgi:predicted acyltransferase
VATLASAILALSVTFAHDWSKAIGPHQKQLLRGSWILMALSLLAGLASLSALAGMAHSRRGDISSKSLRIPWLVQVVTFLLGLGLMVWLGLTLL